MHLYILRDLLLKNSQELEQKRLDEVRSHGEEMQATSIAKADLQANCDLLEQRCVEMEQKIVELQYQNQELVAVVCITSRVL